MTKEWKKRKLRKRRTMQLSIRVFGRFVTWIKIKPKTKISKLNPIVLDWKLNQGEDMISFKNITVHNNRPGW